jgi:hypothetical protein
MIAESQNKALLVVGKSAAENKEWTKYAQYCFDREKGLRKEAFGKLSEFLKETENWTEEEKITFVKFLLPFCEDIPDADYGPLPQPLSEKLIKPTLEKWCETELNDSNPFRWYGRYYGNKEHLIKALELNPHDDRARHVLLEWGTGHLYYSVHHLPEGYIGDLCEDLGLIEELKMHIIQLTDAKLKEFWTQELEEYAELIRNYAEWKKLGHSNLEAWGEKNHKIVSYRIQRVYYYGK